MQSIHNYIPQTNHVNTVYSFAAVLYLQIVLHGMLFRVLNMFCTVTSALPAVCVQCKIWLFLQFFNFVLSRYVAQVPSEWFWNGSSRPYCYQYIIIIIIEFLTCKLWLGNIHLSWDVVINRITLGGLVCSLKSFLQLKMCQELQIFAVVCMYWGAG